MRPVIALLLSTALLAPGCGDKEDGTQCAAICEGTMTLDFADNRSAFAVDIQGTGFSVTLTCPMGKYEGNVLGASAECDEGTVTLFVEAANFPSEISILSEGDRWDFTPDYEVFEECGSTCESVVLALTEP